MTQEQRAKLRRVAAEAVEALAAYRAALQAADENPSLETRSALGDASESELDASSAYRDATEPATILELLDDLDEAERKASRLERAIERMPHQSSMIGLHSSGPACTDFATCREQAQARDDGEVGK